MSFTELTRRDFMKLSGITAGAAAFLAACGSTASTDTAASGDTADTASTDTAAETPAVEIQTETTASDVVSAHVDVMNIASDRDPTNFGPWAGNMGGASAQIPLVYQTLQIKELNGEAEPCLAKTVTMVDDTTYDVELFDYITDSEGNALTADDIAWGVETGKEIGKNSGVKTVDSVEVTDASHLTIHFKNTVAIGDAEGFFCQVPFVTRAAYEAEGNDMAQQAIGSAMYIMASYVGGSVISFEVRDGYWQTDEQYIARSSEAHADTVNFQIITEALQRAIAIEGGTLDYGSVTLNDKERLEGEGYGIIAVPDNLTYMMFLNMNEASALSSNQDLREAIFYAIDNEGLSDLYTAADSVPVYDISNSNYTDYYGDTYKNAGDYYTYDSAKAQELVASSGFSGELTMICGSDEGTQQIAEAVKMYLEVVGLTVNISSYQGNLLSDVAADPANWDIYLLQYASTDYAVNVWEKVLNASKYSWGGTINFVMDEEIQTRLAEVRSIDGHTEENIIAFHNFLVEQAWCKGLIQGIQYFACSAKLDADHIVMSEQRIIRPNATIFVEQ